MKYKVGAAFFRTAKAALIGQVLLVFIIVAWPMAGWAQSWEEASANWENLVPPDVEPAQVEPHWASDLAKASISSPLVITAADFSSDGNDPDGFYFDFAGGYVNGNGTACLKAPAYLPHGAIVDSVYASLYDNAAGNVMVNLRRVNVSTGGSDAMASFGTSSDSTSIQDSSDATISYPEVSYPTYAYYVTTCLNYADHRLYSVRIYYTGP